LQFTNKYFVNPAVFVYSSLQKLRKIGNTSLVLEKYSDLDTIDQNQAGAL